MTSTHSRHSSQVALFTEMIAACADPPVLSPCSTCDNRDGPHKGKINLKYHALLPLIKNVRLLLLREGITQTETRERMAALAAGEILAADEHDYLEGAYVAQ